MRVLVRRPLIFVVYMRPLIFENSHTRSDLVTLLKARLRNEGTKGMSPNREPPEPTRNMIGTSAGVKTPCKELERRASRLQERESRPRLLDLHFEGPWCSFPAALCFWRAAVRCWKRVSSWMACLFMHFLVFLALLLPSLMLVFATTKGKAQAKRRAVDT